MVAKITLTFLGNRMN